MRIPQGSILGPLIVLIFSVLILIEDDTIILQLINTRCQKNLLHYSAIYSDFCKLKKKIDIEFCNYKKDKICDFPILGLKPFIMLE